MPFSRSENHEAHWGSAPDPGVYRFGFPVRELVFLYVVNYYAKERYLVASLSNCQTSCGALVALQHRHILRMSKSFLRVIPCILAVNVQSSRRICPISASLVSNDCDLGCLTGATYTCCLSNRVVMFHSK